MKTIGAYHIGAILGWKEIVAEQAVRIRSSGLLDKTEKILIGISCASDGMDTSWINMMLDGKAVFNLNKSACVHEYVTLKMLHEFVKENDEDFKVWYIHTKGVISGAKGHRLAMEGAVLDHHELCSAILDEKDTCGAYLRPAGKFGTNYNHYAGNFWWARSSYLKTLPEIGSLDRTDRVYSEYWIGMGDVPLTRYQDIGIG